MKKLTTILAILTIGCFLVTGSAMGLSYNDNRPYAVPAQGGIVGYPEDGLQTIFDDTFGTGAIDAINDQSKSALWTPAEGDVDAYLIRMIKGDAGTLGIYDKSGNAYNFDLSLDSVGIQFYNDGTASITDGGGTSYVTLDNVFGFFWYNSTQNMYSYTEDDMNTATGYGPNNDILALSYLVPAGVTGDVTISTPSGDKPYTLNSSLDADDWILAFEDRPFGDAWGDGDFNDAVFWVEDMVAVPEPATMFLLGTGLLGLAAVGRKKFMK